MSDHVVMLKDTSTIKCMHCGMTYDINVPCPSSVFVAILNAYVESHKHCELPKAEKAIKYIAELYNVSIDTAVAVYKDEIEAYFRLLEHEEKEND